MFNLILKDITISKGNFIDVLINCFFMSLFFIGTPAFIYIIVPPLIVYDLCKNCCQYDSRNNSERMLNSLPVNRRDMVLSKYIDCIIFLIFSIMVTIIVTFIFRSLGISGFSYINNLIHLDILNKSMNFQSISMSCIVSTILLISSYFPIYFKFQYFKVRNIFGLVSIIISFIPILFMKIIGNENTYMIVNYFSKGSGLIASVASICILFLILYISVNMSVKFYESRDL